MDLVTQGITGAALAQAVAPARLGRKAALVGLCAGLLPDADALISSAADPLLQLEYHRHFTHALAFIPFGSLLAAVLLWPFLRGRMPFRTLWLFSLCGYATGGLLDACTSYGTHLFWPFSSEPIALSLIAIVDPVFSLALAVPLAIGLRHRKPMRIGLVFAVAYLLFGAVQHERAADMARQVAHQRQHEPRQAIVKPTLANLLLWRSVYTVGDSVYVDALYLGEPARVYVGGSAPLLNLQRDLSWAPDGSRVRDDLTRFSRFARGFVVASEREAHFVGDVRYAMLPQSLEPLWGLYVNTVEPNAATRYEQRRSFTPAIRDSFLTMLTGGML